MHAVTGQLYNTDSSVNSVGTIKLKKKLEMDCVTKTPDYTTVSCLFYIIILP